MDSSLQTARLPAQCRRAGACHGLLL